MRSKFRILIVGASSDLGKPIADALSENGHSLVLHYNRNAERLESLQSDSVFLKRADLCNEEEAQGLFDFTMSSLGGLDVLINMIGPYIERDVLELSPSEWKMMVDLNLNVVFTMCSLSLPQIRENRGHILNFCYDGVDSIRSWKKATAYGAAKAGLAILTKSLANALAPHGARVNAICPGYIDSESFSEDKRKALVESLPQRRLAHPSEVVSLVRWVVEDSPSYINGALLPIGGAWEHAS